jgi:hypothetical protein
LVLKALVLKTLVLKDVGPVGCVSQQRSFRCR